MISASFTARCDGHPIWKRLGGRNDGTLITTGHMPCDVEVTLDTRFSLDKPVGVAYAIAALEGKGWRVELNPPDDDDSADIEGRMGIGWARIECPKRDDA